MAGRGTITVGRLEQNVLSAIQMNMAAGVQLPEKLVNMVGALQGLSGVLIGCVGPVCRSVAQPHPGTGRGDAFC